jgi:hypothetical protein
MENTEKEPIRLEEPGPYQRAELRFVQEVALPPPLQLRGSFVAALAKRRSAEVFAPIAVQELATWLHYTASIQAVNAEDRNRQRRFVASFGALHPTHIVLAGPDDNWTAYVAARHALGQLRVNPQMATSLRGRARDCFPTEEATLIVLLTDADLVDHYYLNAQSLMLRDAGVLLGHGSLVAAALGLGFRILGGSGTLLVERLVPDLEFRPAATGLAWIGGAHATLSGRPSPTDAKLASDCFACCPRLESRDPRRAHSSPPLDQETGAPSASSVVQLDRRKCTDP